MLTNERLSELRDNPRGQVSFTSPADVPSSFRDALADIDLDPSHLVKSPSIEENQLKGGVLTSFTKTSALSVQAVRSTLRVRIELDCSDGERFAFDHIEFQVRTEWPNVIMSYRGQGLPTEIMLTVNLTEQKFQLRFKQENRPLNAHQYLSLLRLENCLSKPFVLRIVDRDTGIEVLQASHPGGITEAPDPDFVEMVEDLAIIQYRLKQIIPLAPGRKLTEEDKRTIAWLRSILHEGSYVKPWTDYSSDVAAESIPAVLDTFGDGRAGWVKWGGESTAMLFGVELRLGEVIHIFRAKLANEEEVRQKFAEVSDNNTPIELKFVPPEDTDAFEVVDYPDWQRAINSATVPPELTSTPTIPPALWHRLVEYAANLKISPEQLLQIGIEGSLEELDEDFQQAADYVFTKNKELYRRLA